MTTFTGISTLDDLNIQTLKGSAVVYGLDKINAEIQKSLAQYNSQVTDMIGAYCTPVTVQTMVFDGTSQITMNEADEFGKSRTKKDSGRWTVSFPLRKYIAGVGYSKNWLNLATVQEVSRKLTSLQIAHQKNLVTCMKKALFNNTNETFIDEHFNGETLTIRRFWNNDASTLPINSSGSSFATSHTHYLAEAGANLAATDINNLVETVTEHDQTEGLMLVIHRADAATVSALTGFTALSSSTLNYSGVTSTVQKLDNSDLSNQLIGYWGSTLMIPVWVKPFAVQNYMLCVATESGDGKPLGYRQFPQPTMQGLMLDTKYVNEPLICEEAMAYEGFGVLNRSAGAVLYFGATTWANPTL